MKKDIYTAISDNLTVLEYFLCLDSIQLEEREKIEKLKNKNAKILSEILKEIVADTVEFHWVNHPERINIKSLQNEKSAITVIADYDKRDETTVKIEMPEGLFPQIFKEREQRIKKEVKEVEESNAESARLRAAYEKKIVTPEICAFFTRKDIPPCLTKVGYRRLMLTFQLNDECKDTCILKKAIETNLFLEGDKK